MERIGIAGEERPIGVEAILITAVISMQTHVTTNKLILY